MAGRDLPSSGPECQKKGREVFAYKLVEDKPLLEEVLIRSRASIWYGDDLIAGLRQMGLKSW